MSKYAVIVSKRVDEMMVYHARFLAQVSIPAAKHLLKEFEEILNVLEERPFQYPVEEDYGLPQGAYRKAMFCKWYKALFSVEGNQVFLDAVIDCRQNHENGIRK